MPRYKPEEKEAMLRFIKRAESKTFLTDLVLNAYNPDYKCDLRSCLRYVEGTKLESDLNVLLNLVRRGVEPQEVVGEKLVEQLINLRKRSQSA